MKFQLDEYNRMPNSAAKGHCQFVQNYKTQIAVDILKAKSFRVIFNVFVISLLLIPLLTAETLIAADFQPTGAVAAFNVKFPKGRPAKERARRLKDKLGRDAVVGEVTYAGTGCPSQSAAVVYSPDRKTVSILFDSFTLETLARTRGSGGGGAAGVPNDDDGGDEDPRNVNRRNCELRFPLLVPRGVQARIAKVDARGYLALPKGARAGIITNARLHKPNGRLPDLTTKYQFKGPLDDLFTIQTKFPSESGDDWTKCGMPETTILNTRVILHNRNQEEDAVVTVDSADAIANDTTMELEVEFKPCRMPEPCNPRNHACRSQYN